ncbi:DNA-3-methyladenine glycosylase [Scopulibacillus daqui]|uniref:Putative 3-methyladenine DNA glycosylase n=1 Tax=Scopulibacillus daqui TaxID=1469162 RepID=A0ABS2Q2I9_9BACL|nr:DNA-3-methyladenine glycosylase [Scopulibacillus daqui]MBM7646518.1 DNA-3-methyladenine glycosylase [Scopulibacillus daqui]
MNVISREFFQMSSLHLAKALLGKTIVHETRQGTTSGIIVETEAYMGPEDRAAHSFGGKRTERTKIMYEEAGHAYIYLIYGMHLCLNIVSGPKEKPEAILIRALEPASGIHLMCERRKIKPEALTLSKKKLLTNGPGKLTKALGITMSLYGHCLTEQPLFLVEEGYRLNDSDIASGPRINIQYAQEAVHYPWRFWIKDNPFVSV